MVMDEISDRYGRHNRPDFETDMKAKEIITQVRQAGYYYILTLMAISIIAILISPATAEPIPFNASIAGDRNLGQLFNWTMNNVSMNADSEYHYTVYDYRIIGDHYDYWSINWGQWFPEAAGPDKVWLAVWVRGWMDGTAYHGWGQDRFFAWVGDKSYKAEPVKMNDIAIRNVKSYGRDPVVVDITKCGETEQRIISTGSNGNTETSGRYLPVVITQLENLKATNERGQLTIERFGWKDENEMDRMEPGYSNRYDGVILFQVPNGTRPEDIRIAGWFGYWGTAVWHLVNTEIDQESVERYRQLETILFDLERETGVRLPDKEIGRTEA
jgi:hypothetical protein